MADASIRDLRHRGGEIVDLAAGGEVVTITRDGKPVAQLRAIPGESLSAVALLARWPALPRCRSSGAAIALANELPIYTANPRDFDTIPGLEVITVPIPAERT